MPEDYYNDAPPAAQAQPDAAAPPQEQGGSEQTALIPKALLAGKDFKPGDEIVLKINAMHGDSVEVSYAPEKGEEGEAPQPEGEEAQAAPAQPPSGGDSEMAAMMQ